MGKLVRTGVFDRAALLDAILTKLEADDTSERQACRDAGVSDAALQDLRRFNPTAETWARWLCWLGVTDAGPFINCDEVKAA